MRNKKRKKNRAFTLIEMMVVIAIIAILILVVSIKQRDNIRRKKVQMDALQVKQMIEFARDYALTGETVTGDKVPDEFVFVLNAGAGAAYQINSSSPSEQNINDLRTNLNSEVRSFDGAREIRYQIPHGTLDTATSITLCHVDAPYNSQFQYTIEVSENKIEMKHLSN